MTVQLEEPHLKALRTIIGEQVDTTTWQPVVFGSRANGKAQRFSDIDLGFIGSKPLPKRMQAQLWDALDESDIPYVVDIVDLTTAGAEFRQVAEQAMVRI